MTVSLDNHLQRLQQKALRAEQLLAAINACIDYPEHSGLTVEMVQVAMTLCRDLNIGLDSVNLPEGGAA